MAHFVLLILLLEQQNDSRPLPDLLSFLSEFRKTFHTGWDLLSQYTYMQRDTQIQLDGNNEPKKTEIRVYEVFPGVEGRIYRRLISKDGVPLSPEKIERQDREHEKFLAEQKRKLGGKNLQRRVAEQKRREEELIDELFAIYDIRIGGREYIDGRPAIHLTFNARPGYKPRTKEGNLMEKFSGRAWVDEEDHQLTRLDMEVMKDISFGLVYRFIESYLLLPPSVMLAAWPENRLAPNWS